MAGKAEWADVGCACALPQCVCGPQEAWLRWVLHPLANYRLTPEQREWCLQEVAKVEGWDRGEHEADNDQDLARSVLSAWADYCRDKGLM